MMALLCPQGDSNPCLGLERAPSWAARRWGRLLYSGRDGIPHAFLKRNKACGIVSSHSSIVNEKDVQFAGSVHANREGHLDIRGARGTCDHDS